MLSMTVIDNMVKNFPWKENLKSDFEKLKLNIPTLYQVIDLIEVKTGFFISREKKPVKITKIGIIRIADFYRAEPYNEGP